MGRIPSSHVREEREDGESEGGGRLDGTFPCWLLSIPMLAPPKSLASSPGSSTLSPSSSSLQTSSRRPNLSPPLSTRRPSCSSTLRISPKPSTSDSSAESVPARAVSSGPKLLPQAPATSEHSHLFFLAPSFSLANLPLDESSLSDEVLPSISSPLQAGDEFLRQEAAQRLRAPSPSSSAPSFEPVGSDLPFRASGSSALSSEFVSSELRLPALLPSSSGDEFSPELFFHGSASSFFSS